MVSQSSFSSQLLIRHCLRFTFVLSGFASKSKPKSGHAHMRALQGVDVIPDEGFNNITTPGFFYFLLTKIVKKNNKNEENEETKFK